MKPNNTILILKLGELPTEFPGNGDKSSKHTYVYVDVEKHSTYFTPFKLIFCNGLTGTSKELKNHILQIKSRKICLFEKKTGQL